MKGKLLSPADRGDFFSLTTVDDGRQKFDIGFVHSEISS